MMRTLSEARMKRKRGTFKETLRSWSEQEMVAVTSEGEKSFG